MPGHNAALQATTRILDRDGVIDRYGSHRPFGTPLAIDGVLPNGTNVLGGPYSVRAAGNGINTFMRATHRQKYSTPPRQHCAFLLAELMPGISRQFLPIVALPTGVS